jgi:hypothetical protein
MNSGPSSYLRPRFARLLQSRQCMRLAESRIYDFGHNSIVSWKYGLSKKSAFLVWRDFNAGDRGLRICTIPRPSCQLDPGEARFGARGSNHSPDDATWWRLNSFEWFYAASPDGSVMNALFVTRDGDFDNANDGSYSDLRHQRKSKWSSANDRPRMSSEPNVREQARASHAQPDSHHSHRWNNQYPNWISSLNPKINQAVRWYATRS